MRYVTYYEENEAITVGRYQQMKQTLLAQEGMDHLQKYTYRKLKFIRSTSEDSVADYALCMKDEDEEQIFLEKKFRQSGVCFKKCLKLNREECERILDGDVEWMKESKKELLADFYLQITLNHMCPGYITEYETERISIGKGKNISFYKKINRGVGITHRLFEKPEIMIRCLDEGKVMVSYQRTTSRPKFLCSMLQGVEAQAEDTEFSF